MKNFTAFNPTQLHFGKDVILNLGESAAKLGKRALLVYGKGSVLKNGSYSDCMDQLKKHSIEIVEYNGIKPNPVVTSVDEAAALGLKNEVDMIIAVGGGSVIDSAKIIGVAIADRANGWDIMTGKHVPESSLPLIAVLTLAATGTEMNPTAVLQNHQTNEKIGFRHPVMFPAHSFLDPSYTLSVPANYTAYGIVDLVAHSLEAWFGKGEAHLSDRFTIAIINEALVAGPPLMKDLGNYQLRERIMWAATNALNNITMHGRVSGDWGVHALGHVLSYLYDTPHGATLSIFYPAWMRRIAERDAGRVVQLGNVLFGCNTAEETIVAFESFFRQLGSPVSAGEVGITADHASEILALMNKNKATGMNYILDQNDRKAIVEMVFK